MLSVSNAFSSYPFQTALVRQPWIERFAENVGIITDDQFLNL